MAADCTAIPGVDMSRGRRQRKSSNWVRRQESDQFVRKARSGGLRARAYFKLEEVDRKHRLIRPSTRLVELGSAPGSWTQYAASRVADPGQVIAVDLLAMEPVAGVDFIQGDFTAQPIVDAILTRLGSAPVDLVLSDMAPNITGIRDTDEARSEEIHDAVFAFCGRALRTGGSLLTKVFEGESAVKVRSAMKRDFAQMTVVKPDASRSQSREIYLLGKAYRGSDSSDNVAEGLQVSATT